MKLSRLFSRSYLRVRRTGVFFCLGYIHYFFSQIINKPHALVKVELLKPVELISGSKLSGVEEELESLKKLSVSYDFNNYFLSLKKLDRNKQFRINAFYPLFYLIDDENYHSFLVNFVVKYCRIYIINKKANDFVWYDMADAFRLSLLNHIFTEDAFKNHLSYKDKKVLSYSIWRHAKYVSQPNYISYGNHAVFQILAAYLFAKSSGDKFLEIQSVDFLKYKFYEQFSKNGIHLEHSPEYHIWAVILFTYVKSQIVDLSDFNLIDKAEYFTKLLFDSNERICLIGDSGIEHSQVYARLIGIKSRKNNNFFCSKDGYLISTAYKNGYYFISHFGSHSKVHKHQDSTSFELDIDGLKVVTDGGKFSYSKSIFASKLRAPLSHNIVDNNQLSMKSYIPKVLFESAEIQFTKLEVLGEHCRFFIILPPYGVIIIDAIEYGSSGIFSNVNFTSRQSIDFFRPLYGIEKISHCLNYYSEEYMIKKEGVRITMGVDKLSAYSILANPDELQGFEICNRVVCFNFRSKNYTFFLE